MDNFQVGETSIPIHFNTRRFSTGEPFTLAGSPIADVYKNGDVAQTTDGVSSITIDFDGDVGSHYLVINTSVNPTFYSAGSVFTVKLVGGTVDGIPVNGAKIYQFSLDKQTAKVPELTPVGTNVAEIKTAFELNGGAWRLTAPALALAPTGGGGGGTDWTTEQRAFILSKIAMIGIPEIPSIAPTTISGKVNTIDIGDDYLVSLDTAFEFTINARVGFTPSSECLFIGKDDDQNEIWNILGDIVDLGDGKWKLVFEMPNSVSSTLPKTNATWKAKLKQGTTVKTVVRSLEKVAII